MLPSTHRKDEGEEISHADSEPNLVNIHDHHSFRFKAIFFFSCLLVVVLVFFQLFPQEVVAGDHHDPKLDKHDAHRL